MALLLIARIENGARLSRNESSIGDDAVCVRVVRMAGAPIDGGIACGQEMACSMLAPRLVVAVGTVMPGDVTFHAVNGINYVSRRRRRQNYVATRNLARHRHQRGSQHFYLAAACETRL